MNETPVTVTLPYWQWEQVTASIAADVGRALLSGNHNTARGLQRIWRKIADACNAVTHA